MPADPLFPGLHARLGLRRRQDPETELQREERIERAERAEAAARKPASTDIASFAFKSATRAKAEKVVERADAGLIAKLLSGLVMGKLIGLDLPANQFADLYAGFATTLQALGLTVTPPAPAPNSAMRSSLRARSVGVSPATADAIKPSTPRSRQKFDAFAAQVVGVPDFQAALDAGTVDGIPLGLVESISALLGAVKAAVLSNDSAALQRIGSDFGSLAAALMAATSGTSGAPEPAQRGYKTVRKVDPLYPRGAITEITWPDGVKTKTRKAKIYGGKA